MAVDRQKKLTKRNRFRVIGLILIGIILFSSLMMIYFEGLPEPATAHADFITVKDGKFNYLDKLGYNFEFEITLNAVKIVETTQIREESKIIIISENSFGTTEFIFNKISDYDVKFTIEHKGNYERNYYLIIEIEDKGYTFLSEKNLLSWSSGYFDYSDMQAQNDYFSISKLDGTEYDLQVDFYNQKDFIIDPLLSADVTLTDPVISELANGNTGDIASYQPLYADDSITDDDLGYTSFDEDFNGSIACASYQYNTFWQGRVKNTDGSSYYQDNTAYDKTVVKYNFESGSGSTVTDMRGSDDGIISSSVVTSALVSQWTMEEGTGDVIEDIISSHNGTNNGADWTTTTMSAYSDRALDFENDNEDYIEIPDHDDFSFTDGAGNDEAFSISMWFKLETIDKQNQLISKLFWESTPEPDIHEWEWFCMINTLNKLQFSVHTANSGSFPTGDITLTTAQTFTTGSFYHVLITYDGSELFSGFTVYVNGVSVTLQDASTGSYTGMNNLAASVCIGGNASSLLTDHHFDGIIDQVSIYSAEKSASEALMIYKSEGERFWNASTFNDASDYGLRLESNAQEYVNFSDATDFTFTGAFSISLWVKILDKDTNTNMLLAKYDTGDTYNREYYISRDWNNNGFRVDLYTNQSSSYVARRIGATNIVENQWYHLVVTYDGSTGSSAYEGINIYINGTKETSFDSETASASFTGMIDTPAPLYSGYLKGSGYMANFHIDQVQLINYELSESEAQWIFNNDPAEYDIHQYQMERSSGVGSYSYHPYFYTDLYYWNESVYPRSEGYSTKWWFTYPLDKRIGTITSATLKIQIGNDTAQTQSDLGYSSIMYNDLDSNDYLYCSLVENQVIDSFSVLDGTTPEDHWYPAFNLEGGWSRYLSTIMFNRSGEEEWNLLQIEGQNASYQFTGSETIGTWLDIDITDMVAYWQENLTYNSDRLGFQVWMDSADHKTWFSAGNYTIEYTYDRANVLTGINNPYWGEISAESVRASMSISEVDDWNALDNEGITRQGFGGAATYYLGGKNWNGRAQLDALEQYSYNVRANDEYLRYNFTKLATGAEGSGLSNTWYEIAMLDQGYAQEGKAYGEYSIRFRATDNITGTYSSTSAAALIIRVSGNAAGVLKWQASRDPSLEGSLGVTHGDIWDGEWHDIIIRITPDGGFIRNDRMQVEILLDGKVLTNGNPLFNPDFFTDYTWGYDSSRSLSWYGDWNGMFADTSLTNQYPVEINIGLDVSIDEGWSVGEGICLDVDEMSLKPYIYTGLSLDSTNGNCSIESFNQRFTTPDPLYNTTLLRSTVDKAGSQTDCVSFWRFDEYDSAVSTVYDDYGDHHGTNNGASYTTTKKGGFSALDFEESESDYVTIVDTDDFTFNSAGDDEAFSISIWIRVESYGSSWAGVVTKWGASIALQEWMLAFDDSETDKIGLTLIDSSGKYIRRIANQSLSLNQWYHIVVTYDASETISGITFYIDSVEVASYIDEQVATYSGMSNTATDVLIGNAVIYYFDGIIDHLKIYSAELNQSQVTNLYSNDVSDIRSYQIDYYDIDGLIDASDMYASDNSGRTIEGIEALILNFGDYHRRRDSNTFLNYQTEGMDLFNTPIMEFDMKIDVNSTFGFLYNETGLSNAYLTIYNESLIPVANNSWYLGGSETTGYTTVQRDFGFTLIENQWVSIRLDLRQSIEIYDEWFDVDKQSPLSAVGAIGFSFLFNCTDSDVYVNQSYLSYSVKIDDLKFIPVQTVAYQFYSNVSFVDAGEEDLTAYAMSTASWNYDYVIEGQKSVRITEAAQHDQMAIDFTKLSFYQADPFDIADGGYIIFWIYPLDGDMGFTSYSTDPRFNCLRLIDSTTNKWMSRFNFYRTGKTGYISSLYDSDNEALYWIPDQQWTLVSIPVSSYIMGDTGASGTGIKAMWFDGIISQGTVDFIIDGFAYVDASVFDYANLSVQQPFTSWTVGLTVNSSYGKAVKGYYESGEIYTDETNAFFTNYTQLAGKQEGVDDQSYTQDMHYVASNEGIDTILGYSWDFETTNESTLPVDLHYFENSSNVNLQIVNGALYCDVIDEAVDQSATYNVWIKNNFTGIIPDFTYWNMMQVKLKIVDETNNAMQGYLQNTAGFNAFDLPRAQSGWSIVTIPVDWWLEYDSFSDYDFFVDNSTFVFHWRESSVSKYSDDIMIDWIKLLHYEGDGLQVSTINAAANWEDRAVSNVYYWSDYVNVSTANVYHDTDVKLYGNDSLAVDLGNGSLYDTQIFIGGGATGGLGRSGTVVRHDTYAYYWAYNDRHYWDWSACDYLEFYIRSNETLTGGGDTTYGQISIQLLSANSGQRKYYNVTDNWIEGYTGSMVADTWYKVKIPLADYNWTMGTFTQSQVYRMVINIYNAWHTNGAFSTGDGQGEDSAYKIYIDGLRCVGDDYTAFGSVRELNGTYDTFAVPGYTSQNFGFEINRSVLLKHDLQYELSRNPSVSSYTGYVNNGSNQVVYELIYTISEFDYNSTFSTYNHSFFVPVTYTFYNVTFPNGTTKTIESGFTIDTYNSTHYQVVVTEWLDGDWTWYFITENTIGYVEISPSYSDGLQYNTTSIDFNIQALNTTDGIPLVNYPVSLALKNSQDTALFTQTTQTSSGGWANGTMNAGEFAMLSNHLFYFTVTGTNESWLGYNVTTFTSYQDFDAPTISSVDYASVLDPFLDLDIDLIITDVWTSTADIEVIIYYSFISSGSFEFTGYPSYTGSKFEMSINGRTADTSIWFKITVTDNLSNSYTTPVYSASWYEQPEGVSEDGSSGGSSGTGGSVVSGGAANLNTLLILVFIFGSIFAAILVTGLLRRVQIRTRRVEEREVITVLGKTGRSKERIEIRD